MFGGPINLGPPPPMRLRRGNRDVPGPGLYEAGRIALYPGANWNSRKLHAMQRSREYKEKAEALAKRTAIAEANKAHFVRTTDAKGLVGRAKVRVAAGLIAADIDLDKRREKLRALLCREQAEQTAELVARAQCLAVERLQFALTEAQNLRAQEEKDRQEEADRLRFLQYRRLHPEFRMHENREAIRKTMEAQQYQIHEKIWKRGMEKQEEKLWAEIAKKNDDAMKLREEDEVRVARARALQNARIQLEQMEALRVIQVEDRKQIMQEERMLNERMQASAGAGAQQERERLHKLQLEQRAALDNQRAETAAIFSDIDEAERRYDAAVLAHEMAELKLEGYEEVEKKMKRQRDMLRYLQSVEETREKVLEDERKADEKVQALAKAKDRERDERRCQMKNARLQMFKETLEVRAQQVEGLRARARAEAQREKDERRGMGEAREANLQLAAEEARCKWERGRRYAHDLEDQMHYQDLLKCREKALDRERMEQEQAKAEELEATIRALIEKPTATLRQHPLVPAIKRDPAPQAPEAQAPHYRIPIMYDGPEEVRQMLCPDAKTYSCVAVPTARPTACVAIDGTPRVVTTVGAGKPPPPSSGPHSDPRQAQRPPCTASRFDGMAAGMPPPPCCYPPAHNVHDPGTAQCYPPAAGLRRKTTGRLGDTQPTAPCRMRR